VRDSVVAQPVNTASCVAYVVAGAWLWRRLRRHGRVPAEASLFCAMVAANGLGGVGFHGPGDRGSHWLHDTALVGTLAAMTLPTAPIVGGASALAAVGIALRPDATNAASLAGGVLVAASEARARRRPSARTGLLLIAAAGVNTLSRTGGRWCRPDSPLQGHALWHVLTAAALADWGDGRFGPPT
jgi:hypothetical protein